MFARHQHYSWLVVSCRSSFGGAVVLEVVEDGVGGTYRAVYTVKFTEAVFVLDCSQK